jgi:HEAT repeat protein
MSLDSRMLSGSEPRVSATGEGRIEFDRARGLPKRVELECKTLSVTENLSRRSLVTLSWQLLEGADRDKALAPPPPPPPQTSFTLEELARLQQQLQSEDLGIRHTAVRELSGSRLGKPTPEMLARMATLANDPDDTLRRAALAMLANHGTKDQVPLLIKGLNDPDTGTRTAVAKGLGRLKDPRAVEPLVNLLATGQNDQPYYRPNRESAAAEALVRIGPAAEPAVLALLKEKNLDTRMQACNVLKQIGTKKSLGPLKDLTLNPSKELSEAAAEACRSIQSRETN